MRAADLGCEPHRKLLALDRVQGQGGESLVHDADPAELLAPVAVVAEDADHEDVVAADGDQVGGRHRGDEVVEPVLLRIGHPRTKNEDGGWLGSEGELVGPVLQAAA